MLNSAGLLGGMFGGLPYHSSDMFKRAGQPFHGITKKVKPKLKRKSKRNKKGFISLRKFRHAGIYINRKTSVMYN